MEKLVRETDKLNSRLWVFLGMKLPKYIERIASIDNPYNTFCIGQIYPWQVAPQQSLCLFQFDNTKVINFIKKLKNLFFVIKSFYICKHKIGLKINCKLISVFKYKSVNFF